MAKNEIIRTPDFVGGGITEQEKCALDEHAKLWIKRIMRTDPIEPDKIIPAIQGLYYSAGLKIPKVIIVPSPIVMAFAYGAAAWILHTRKHNKSATYSATRAATIAATRAATDDATDDATYDATRDATNAATRAATYSATRAATRDATDDATYSATRDATRDATDDATYDATIAATRDATDDATRAATYSATRAATDDATDDATYDATDASAACFELAGIGGLKCVHLWYNSYQGGNMWGQYDSYLTAMRDILGLKLKQHEAFKFWEDAAIHGGFRVMHEEFCMVSDFPEILQIDDQNRPHCENGPSHRWRDGFELYHWHGVRIPDEWIKTKSLTAKTAITWENIEQRRAACEIIGWHNVLYELNAKVIDEDEDPEIGTLLEADIPDSGKERFLQVKCGTGRTFCIPVERSLNTALEANSWTYGLDKFSFKPEVRT